MRERYNFKHSIGFTETLGRKIQDTADKLSWNFSDVVRECVELELPRLIDRETKRIKRRTKQENNS